MIISNKLDVVFDKGNIDRDFDIYMISKEGKGDYFKNNVLDIPNIKFKARSVVYTWGNEWFVMFAKNSIDYKEFKEAIVNECPEGIINKIDVRMANTIYPNVLAQLLFNSLASPERKNLQYNNLTGKLYYSRPSWMKKMPNMFYLMNLKLSSNFYMIMSVHTFSKVSKVPGKVSNSQYVFDRDSLRFRKKFKGDNYPIEESYVVKNTTSKHNTVDFLDFSSYEKFCDCKIGVFTEFISDVEECLADYIAISIGGYDKYENYEIEHNGFENKLYSDILAKRHINIVDDVLDEKSEIVCKRLLDHFERYYNLIATLGKLDLESYNIRVIRNKDFYKKYKLEDPHAIVDSSYIVQHVTTDDFKFLDDKESPAFKKIAQELIIKGDIKERKFSIVNWQNSGYDYDWTFVRSGKVRWGDNSNGKKVRYRTYYKMIISKDGTFKVDSYDNSEFVIDKEWNAIDDAYHDYDVSGREREVEGLVYKNINNINILMKTEQTTMPNFKVLSKVLELCDKNKTIPTSTLIGYAKEFVSERTEYAEEIDMFVSELEQMPQHSKIGDVNKVLRIKTNFGKVLNQYIFQNSGILINAKLKGKENIEEYFDALLDIKYFYVQDKLYYFVGTAAKNLQLSLHNACFIREVASTGNEINFNELMQLMAVEFVRNGQYTVVPFPFKYLNEIIAMS